MSEDENNTTYLLRDIPRELWGRVRNKAFNQGLTIRQYLINLMDKDTQSWREKQTATVKSPKES